jgi:hypothetical protein
MPESNFTGVFLPDKLTMQSSLAEAVDDFYVLPEGIVATAATLQFLPWAWRLFWSADCYMNLVVEPSIPGPTRKTPATGAVSQSFQVLVANNFVSQDPALATFASGKRGWSVTWPDGQSILFSPSPSVPGPTLVRRALGTLPNDGLGVLGQVKLLGELDDPLTPDAEGSYLMVGDQAGSGQRVGISARYIGWVGAGEAVKTQIFVDASGDLYVQQTAGPNVGKRIDITKGHWS